MYPTLPNGGWSITVELHFYLLLPVLLWLFRRWSHSLLVLVLASSVFRLWLLKTQGNVQGLAYFTLIGHLDQFLLGIWVTQFRESLARRHLVAVCIFLAFAAIYWRFDAQGGFYGPPGRLTWVWLPTVEIRAAAVNPPIDLALHRGASEARE